VQRVKRILVTGAGGQIGSELVPALRAIYGEEPVLATDIRPPGPELSESGPFAILDGTDQRAVGQAVMRHRADTIYHLAAILSAVGEKDPRLAYDVNMGSLHAVLEVAREQGCAVFTPSSIGVFGPGTPKDPTPQDTVMRPTTMYGVTKVAAELLCDYYHQRFGVDTRGVRYPGLISHGAPPGGGTTDWAVDIFYQAVSKGRYTCFLGEDTQLDMMYMPDALRAAIEIMEADSQRLRHRNAFNVTAMQLSPRFLAQVIRRHVPAFEIDYDVDPVREAIAQSWPRRIDDSAARAEWGWAPEHDVDSMAADMIQQLRRKLAVVP
jgi:nucleoside-diphosphate-sugar epimerase